MTKQDDGWRHRTTITVTVGGAFVFETPDGRAVVILIGCPTVAVDEFAARTIDRALADGWRYGQLVVKVLADGDGVAFRGIPPSTLSRYAMEALVSFE